MIFLERPYFLSNEKWYYFDEDAFCYKLTDKATDEAKESYRKTYEALNGNHIVYDKLNHRRIQ